MWLHRCDPGAPSPTKSPSPEAALPPSPAPPAAAPQSGPLSVLASGRCPLFRTLIGPTSPGGRASGVWRPQGPMAGTASAVRGCNRGPDRVPFDGHTRQWQHGEQRGMAVAEGCCRRRARVARACPPGAELPGSWPPRASGLASPGTGGGPLSSLERRPRCSPSSTQQGAASSRPQAAKPPARPGFLATRPPAHAPRPSLLQMVKKERRAKEAVTREYTINLHKKLQSINFKKRAPRAVKEIKKFAKKMMGTKDVRIDVRLNKELWSKGVKNVPNKLRIVVSRRRNDDEDAKVRGAGHTAPGGGGAGQGQAPGLGAPARGWGRGAGAPAGARVRQPAWAAMRRRGAAAPPAQQPTAPRQPRPGAAAPPLIETTAAAHPSTPAAAAGGGGGGPAARRLWVLPPAAHTRAQHPAAAAAAAAAAATLRASSRPQTHHLPAALLPAGGDVLAGDRRRERARHQEGHHQGGRGVGESPPPHQRQPGGGCCAVARPCRPGRGAAVTWPLVSRGAVARVAGMDGGARAHPWLLPGPRVGRRVLAVGRRGQAGAAATCCRVQ